MATQHLRLREKGAEGGKKLRRSLIRETHSMRLGARIEAKKRFKTGFHKGQGNGVSGLKDNSFDLMKGAG